jgi:hypothetical protein
LQANLEASYAEARVKFVTIPVRPAPQFNAHCSVISLKGVLQNIRDARQVSNPTANDVVCLPLLLRDQGRYGYRSLDHIL